MTFFQANRFDKNFTLYCCMGLVHHARLHAHLFLRFLIKVSVIKCQRFFQVGELFNQSWRRLFRCIVQELAYKFVRQVVFIQ